MKTIKFDISHKDKIVSGQWKVITCYGDPVEIVKWDCKIQHPILAYVSRDKVDYTEFYTENGEGHMGDYLLIVTDISEEEELAELTLEAIRVAINSEQIPYEQRVVYSSKVLPYVKKLLGVTE